MRGRRTLGPKRKGTKRSTSRIQSNKAGVSRFDSNKTFKSAKPSQPAPEGHLPTEKPENVQVFFSIDFLLNFGRNDYKAGKPENYPKVMDIKVGGEGYPYTYKNNHQKGYQKRYNTKGMSEEWRTEAGPRKQRVKKQYNGKHRKNYRNKHQQHSGPKVITSISGKKVTIDVDNFARSNEGYIVEESKTATEQCLKDCNILFNQITLKNQYDKLKEFSKSLNKYCETVSTLKQVVMDFFEKATKTEAFAGMFAEFAKKVVKSDDIKSFEQTNPSDPTKKKTLTFKYYLLRKCQTEFYVEEKKFLEIKDIEKRKNRLTVQRLTKVASIVFIGKLYTAEGKKKLIKDKHVDECIDYLIKSDLPTELNIEILCNLLKVVGPSAEDRGSLKNLDRAWRILEKLKNEERYEIRYIFMIEDLFDERARGWVAKGQQRRPKKKNKTPEQQNMWQNKSTKKNTKRGATSRYDRFAKKAKKQTTQKEKQSQADAVQRGSNKFALLEDEDEDAKEETVPVVTTDTVKIPDDVDAAQEGAWKEYPNHLDLEELSISLQEKGKQYQFNVIPAMSKVLRQMRAKDQEDKDNILKAIGKLVGNGSLSEQDMLAGWAVYLLDWETLDMDYPLSMSLSGIACAQIILQSDITLEAFKGLASLRKSGSLIRLAIAILNAMKKLKGDDFAEWYKNTSQVYEFMEEGKTNEKAFKAFVDDAFLDLEF